MESHASQTLDYAPPGSVPTPRWQRLLLGACWLYPPVVLASIYATWFLGHRPRGWKPSNLITDALQSLTLFLILTSPLVGWSIVVVGLLLTLKRDDTKPGRARTRILLIAWYVSYLVVANWDPFGALDWLLD